MFDRQKDQFRTFGRTRGRALKPAQARLMDEIFPSINIGTALERGTDPLVSCAAGPVWLEIGFGGAEHLLWQAERNPDVTLIGAEPFLNGVAKAVRGIAEQDLSNIRLLNGDVRDLLEALPDNCLDRVFILFPDPWPKSRHNKRRIINRDFIKELYRVMKPGSELRFASDIIDYVDWSLTRLYAHGGFDWPTRRNRDWRERQDDWPGTRYEAKAVKAGRPCHYFSFRVKK